VKVLPDSDYGKFEEFFAQNTINLKMNAGHNIFISRPVNKPERKE